MKTTKEPIQVAMETRNLKEIFNIPVRPNRSTKKLLRLLLDFGNENFLKYHMLGLCYLSKELRHEELINYPELQKLLEFIHNNRPQKNSPHYRKSQNHSDYWWGVNIWAPRKRWLTDQIKSL